MKKLTIGLDLRGLDPTFKAHSERGTGRYIRELSSRLLETDCDDFNFVSVTRATLDLNEDQLRLLRKLPRGKVTFESQICLRNNVKKTGADIVHFFSHGDAPAYPITPQISTILDLIPLKFPSLYQTKDLNFRYKVARFLENRAARSSKGIIAISEATKRDIVDILKIPEHKIAVTYLGVDQTFLNSKESTPDEKETLLERYAIPKSAALGLYVGGLDARKNIDFLIKLISELNFQTEKFKESGGFYLGIVGNFKKEKTFDKIQTLIKELNLGDKIKFFGFVENDLLLRLYKIADIFIFPSLYEGFGLPVLEAMASNCIVAAGNNSCMPEVVGNVTFLYPDNNLKLWARGIEDLVSAKRSSSDLLKEHLEINRKKALSFTWEKTTSSTIEAYRSFLIDNETRKQN